MSSGVHERNGIVQSTARHERQCICHTECMGFMQTGKRDACSQMHASQYATHRQLKKFDSGPIRGTSDAMADDKYAPFYKNLLFKINIFKQRKTDDRLDPNKHMQEGPC
eukprot:scaffold311254_cov12-Tisochrysis_lutea.AAC.1